MATDATIPGLRATASAMRCQIPLSVRGFCADVRNERPEQPLPEQRRQRWQYQQDEHCRHHQPRRGLHTQASGARRCGEHQGEQGKHNGRVARDDRGPGPPHRHIQCATSIIGAPQFLSVPRDEQQCIVRAGPEHQHAGDARRRTVGLHAHRFGDRTADDSCDSIGERDHRERHQPQHRRAVGDDQQQRDDGSRHRQQRDVGPGERVRDVRSERGSACDLDAQMGRHAASGRVAERLDRIVERKPRQIRVHRYRGHSGATVAGHLQRTLRHCGQVGRAERFAVAPADDDDGRNTVSAGELRPQRVGPCRLGAGRHGYRRLLARGVVADQRHQGPGNGDHQERQHPREAVRQHIR